MTAKFNTCMVKVDNILKATVAYGKHSRDVCVITTMLSTYFLSFLISFICSESWQVQQAVDGLPPRYAPLLSSTWAPSRRQRSSSFPRPTRSYAHRSSRLTRQHGGEQSGLVTLTFHLLTLKVVSESHVTLVTSVPILVFLGLSVLDLGPMYATDRRQTDRRQTKALLNVPAY